MFISTALLVGTTIVGFIFQFRNDAHVLAAHPPPGSFVNAGDHKIHVRTLGEGEFTFVLEAGLGDYSGNWGRLENALAEIGRVFVYDRAGLGWSEEGPQPR